MGVLCCSQAKRGERAGSGQIPRTGTPERKSQTVSTTAHPLYPHSLSHSSSEDCNSAELGYTCSPAASLVLPPPGRSGLSSITTLLLSAALSSPLWVAPPRDVPRKQHSVTFLSVSQSQAVHH